MKKGFTPPTTGVTIALKTGVTFECEMWLDQYEMFHEMWSATDPSRPEVLTLPSVANDEMSIPSDIIAYAHRFHPEALSMYEEAEYIDDDYND